jgi:hypothetical protein
MPPKPAVAHQHHLATLRNVRGRDFEVVRIGTIVTE